MQHYDEELLKAKCGKGDQEAMIRLWQAHREFVIQKAYAYLEDKAYAIDIRSTVKRKFLAALQKEKIKGRCESWLSSVVHNTCMDKFRKDRQDLEMLERLEARKILEEPDEAAEARREMAWNAIEKVLKNYAVEDQYLIIAFHIKGKSAAELAAIYKKNNSFVYEKTRKFLKDVRETLGLVNRD